MTKSDLELIKRRVQEVAREYRSKGYEVITNPRKDDLPDFLKDYELDIIAKSESENVVIEVKTFASGDRGLYLKEIANEIQKHPSWRFELVITNPKADSFSEEQYRLLSESELLNRINEIRQLLTTGHEEAALLLGWATVEGALRVLAQNEGVSLSKRSPGYIIKYLTSLGLISKSSHNLLQRTLEARNEVVHGLKPVSLNPKAIESLLNVIDKIVRQENP